MKPTQDGRHFADNIIELFFFNELKFNENLLIEINNMIMMWFKMGSTDFGM